MPVSQNYVLVVTSRFTCTYKTASSQVQHRAQCTAPSNGIFHCTCTYNAFHTWLHTPVVSLKVPCDSTCGTHFPGWLSALATFGKSQQFDPRVHAVTQPRNLADKFLVLPLWNARQFGSIQGRILSRLLWLNLGDCWQNKTKANCARKFKLCTLIINDKYLGHEVFDYRVAMTLLFNNNNRNGALRLSWNLGPFPCLRKYTVRHKNTSKYFLLYLLQHCRFW